MKYIDADRLRAEIENLIERYGSIKTKGILQEGYMGGRLIGYEDALNKLDSLQQEQPEVDLEEEFADFLEKENAYVDDNDKISYYNGSSFDHTFDIYPIARHFYELGLNARKA